MTRKQKADIYWSFQNKFINNRTVCDKYKISTFEMQDIVDEFQKEMDKLYMSNRKGRIHIELFCYNLRNYHPELIKTK